MHTESDDTGNRKAATKPTTKRNRNSLKNEFPQEFRELVKIIGKAATHQCVEIADTERRVERTVGPIIFRHRHYQSREYQRDLVDAQKFLFAAAALVDETYPKLMLLDKRKTKSIRMFAKYTNSHLNGIGKKRITNLDTLARDLKLWGTILMIFSGVNPKPTKIRGASQLQKATSTLFSVWEEHAAKFYRTESKLGRNSLVTGNATNELILAWKKLTGLNVITPDTKPITKNKRESKPRRNQMDGGKEDSTQYIEICLRMIFPGTTTANAQTSIRKSLKQLKSPNPIIEQLASILASKTEPKSG